MSENRTNKSIKNMITGVIYKIIGILFPFIIRTVMIKKLGSEYMGLNSLFTSILQMLSLSELGIGNAMVYSMYKPIAENDRKCVCALLALYQKCYRYIGTTIMLIGLLLLPFLNLFIKGSYPTDINLYTLYLIYLFNTVISYFLFAYKRSILDATQNVGIENMIQTFFLTIMYCIQIVILWFLKNYYVYIIFLPITTLFINLYRFKIVTKMYPEFQPYGIIDKEFICDLKSKIKALIGYKIGNNVIWFSDSIIISAFLGLNVLAMYSNYYYIMNAIMGMLAIFYNSILASVGNSLITEKVTKNYKDFINLNFINTWIVSFCTICLLCLYQPFMELWMGKELMFNLNIVILFTVYFYTWMFNKIANMYFNAAGLWTYAFWKPYISSVVNLAFNIILVNVIGISGVLISTIIASIFIETLWESLVIHKYLFKMESRLYYLQLLKGVIFTVILSLLTYFICSFINLRSLVLTLLFRIIICIIIPNILYIIIFRKTNELKFSINKMKKVLIVDRR